MTAAALAGGCVDRLFEAAASSRATRHRHLMLSLDLEFWRPREEPDVQRAQWVDDVVSLGWHKDDDHPDPGTTRFQLDFGDELVHEPGHLAVEAPLRFLERCLDRLPTRLRQTTDR